MKEWKNDPLSMVTISIYFELYLPGVRSLKEKRHILRSIKDTLRNKFNISIREVSLQDKWQRSGIGISLVHYDITEGRKIVSAIDDMIWTRWNVSVVKKEVREW